MPTAHKLPARKAGDRPPAVIAPSVLNADVARLADECSRLVGLGSDWMHVDCMVCAAGQRPAFCEFGCSAGRPENTAVHTSLPIIVRSGCA